MIEAFVGETKRPIMFKTGLDLDGQTLSAYAYDETGAETDITSQLTTAIGNKPNIETTVFIEIPVGLTKGQYNVKVATSEVVASRDQMIVYGEDPYDY